MFSEKDGTLRIAVTIGGTVREHLVQSPKDITVETGDTTTQVMGGGQVAFIAEGGNKPAISVTITSGMESAKLRALLMNGVKKRVCRVTYACRRDGQSLVYALLEAKLGEGGGVKASDADGVGGDKAFKFLGKRLEQSINGGGFARTA